MSESKVLRCFAKQKSDGLWIAMCIDLSLATQGDTAEDAITKLNDQVIDYVQEAFREPEYTEQLLDRPSPLSCRIEYYKVLCLFRFARLANWFRDLNSAFRTFDYDTDKITKLA
jgi:hypothetical protein